MRSKLLFLIVFLFELHLCKAQDSAVVLSTSMFDRNFQTISLSARDGWIFKEGNDTGRAKKDILVTDWKKFNPSQLTIENADKNGRVEGWFRIRFRLDASFQDQPVGIQMERWAATDVYVDGTYIISAGNTGLNGQPYEENRMTRSPSLIVDIKPGIDHVLALHLVDYRSALEHSLLKTGTGEHVTGGFGSLVKIAGPEALTKRIQYQKESSSYWSIWISVCAVLSLAFWFLYFQNRSEKNLLLIAITNTFFSLGIFCDSKISIGAEMSFSSWSGYFYVRDLFWGLSVVPGILFFAYVFRRKISFPLVLVTTIMSLLRTTDDFFFGSRLGVPLGVSFILICLYFIISSWKNLKGAQWAIVVGYLSFCIWNFLFWYNYAKYLPAFPFPFAYLYLTGIFLSAPLSQMVYVAMRFNEILHEVRENARQVVQISEEKKELLANQNIILEKQVGERTAELNKSLQDLRSTQAQLIQSEKMASLGELTAGIAHEIQNPLNFVNNFSEVNIELIDELEQEAGKGNLGEVKAITKNIKENEQKINHHGKRADAIVKGMLQHGRSSSGEKEPANINALADEYLRLAYHGLRAKDNSFNATIKTDFDEKLSTGEAGAGNINIIPQDIGRVILNLLTNAFYAVKEKQKQNLPGYEAHVMVKTKLNPPQGGRGASVEIKVTDNGGGIPQKVLDKIFQPFFTTKPTGQGTGLGLSLSYDIVKAHGGEIKVNTKEGEFTEFVVQLPVVA